MVTKQSLGNKPFCMALGKEWTLSTSTVDLREIFTDLSWIRKHRKAYTVEQEDLKNITQILSEEQLGEDGPVRILVQGTIEFIRYSESWYQNEKQNLLIESIFILK